MPICKYCHQDRAVEDFQIAGEVNGVVYRRKRCSPCKIALQNARKSRIHSEVAKYKSLCGCKTCGFTDHRALQFHHEASETKEIAVAQAINNGWSLKKLFEEIRKCVVLCANCHMVLHAAQRELARSVA